MRGFVRSAGVPVGLLSLALLLGCTEVTKPAQAVGPLQTSTVSASASAAPGRACILHGTVTSDTEAPVPGALIAAIPAGGEEPAAVTKADAQGRYCFPALDAGSFGFTVTAPDVTADYVDVRNVSPAGMNQATIDFHMGGPGYVLSGVAIDRAGAPLRGARVYVPRFSDFMADLFLTETDQEGRYRVKLREATYAPFVRSDTHVSDRSRAELTKDLTVNLTAQALNPKDRPAPDEVVAWIKSKAIPLTGVEAGRAFDDMAPLAALVGDARLVALGEATHGSREFFQMKHRMLEYLVETKGFRSFGIEASFGDCLPLSDYVRTGKGDPADALANQGFWTWDTEEVLALVRWMRAYNEDKTHKEKLSFWGFDMQSPAASAQALLAYLGKVDPALAKEIGPSLEPLDDDFTPRYFDSVPKKEVLAAAEAVKKVLASLEARRADYEKKTDQRSLLIAGVHARVLQDFLLQEGGEHSARDRSMAEVAGALLAIEDVSPSAPGGGSSPKASRSPAKMVLWAHNGHVNKQSNGGPVSMGAHLAKRFGDDYKVFGFAFDEGSFQAVDVGKEHRGLIPFTVPPASPGSLDHTLARAGMPFLALDLRGAPKGPVSDWLSRASATRSIGSMFDASVPDFGLDLIVPPLQYDAVLFVQKTTPARANRTGKRAGQAEKQAPLRTLEDGGFEAAKKGELPAGWGVTSIPRQLVYKAIVTDKGCATGKQCLTIERTKGDVSTGFASAAVTVDVAHLAGRAVLISASVRVEGKGIGDEAFLFASTRDDAARWTRASGPGWKKVEMEYQVPREGGSLHVGLGVTGAARGFLDEVAVQALPQ